MSLTMSEETPYRCPEFSCQKKFTSDSGRLTLIKLHHPEYLQFACQKNLDMRSTPRHNGPAQHHEFKANIDSVEALDMFPYLEHLENIAALEPQLRPPPLLQMKTYPSTGALESDYIAEASERDTHRSLGTNIQTNPYYLFAMHEEYNYIQCWINMQGMKTYYDNVLKEENTTPHFPSIKNGDGIQILVTTIQDDQARMEWELHTLEDMRWNDNHQRPIENCSRNIIKSTTWLMRQPAYATYLNYPPQRCITAIRHRNASIPQCTLQTGSGRQR